MASSTPDVDDSRHLSILICSRDRFPPTRPDVKILFLKEMRARGHQVDWLLLSPSIGQSGYCTTLNGSSIWVAPSHAGASVVHRGLNALRQTAHAMRLIPLGIRGKYKIIQIKDRFFAVIPGLIAAIFSGARFVFWLSYPYALEDAETARRKRGLERIFFAGRAAYTELILRLLVIPFSAHIFVQSASMRKSFIDCGCDPDRLTAVPMGFDRNEVAAALIQPVTVDPHCVCYLGTLSRVRDPLFMLDVIAAVRRDYPGAYLLLIGKGESQADERDIVEYAQRIGVGAAVRMTGHLPRDEAWQLVRTAVVCLSPFRPSEVLEVASPTKLVEYMALGKAVVANDIPEQRDLISASGGGLCVEYSVAMFANAIGSYLQDPQEAALAGQRGQRHVNQVRDYSRIATDVERTYRRVIGGDEQRR